MSNLHHEDDLNKDGIVTPQEIEAQSTIRKSTWQRRIAVIAIAGMIITMWILLSPWVTETRIESLGGIVEVFFFALASVVGTYMGVSGWMATASMKENPPTTKK